MHMALGLLTKKMSVPSSLTYIDSPAPTFHRAEQLHNFNNKELPLWKLRHGEAEQKTHWCTKDALDRTQEAGVTKGNKS